MRISFVSRIAFATLSGLAAHADEIPSSQPPTGSVIFIHPDGAGMEYWNALRLWTKGPDGELNWDRLPHLGVYRSDLTDALVASSHAGATVHAYGIKVAKDSFGTNAGAPITAASGSVLSILHEAREAGFRTGAVNSGHLCEPGTAVFLTSAPSREDTDFIAAGIVNSGADVILSGGEVFLLPAGEVGHFGEPGIRKDGQNLIQTAQANGYRVVLSTEEMEALPADGAPVFGVFAARHTFNDQPEEALREKGLPLYNPDAPDLATLTREALRQLSIDGSRFFLVVEEEGTDNFGNTTNAVGALSAASRADAAIVVALDWISEHPDTLLIVAADSEAGGLSIFGPSLDSGVLEIGNPIFERFENGAPVDGVTGTAGVPFVSQPGAHAPALPFAIGWSTHSDIHGGILARASGLNAERLPPLVDNTDIYRLMYLTLFGRDPGSL